MDEVTRGWRGAAAETVVVPVTALSVEPGLTGAGVLIVAATYAAPQSGLLGRAAPARGAWVEVYQYRGPYLVLESQDFTEE